ncbi:MAG: helix-turn-helix domain containing protein [Syntrophobacteraceae bacterium]|nr:helix-turn-helix domain containing protein [Syntrophobacteraceae bacterium]
MKMDGSDMAGYLSAEEIKMKMRMSTGFLRFQKWLVIYNLLVDPRPLAEIARHTGLSESSVYRIVAEYNDAGPESVETIGDMGRKAWFQCAGGCSL